MARHIQRSSRLAALASISFFFIGACTAAPTPTATPSPATTTSPTTDAAPTPSPSGSAIPSIPVDGCAQEAGGAATEPQNVHIRDIAAQTYPYYDVLVFDFDRGLPEYIIKHVEPPLTMDPSGLPLTVQGSYFFSIVFHGASIMDEEFQPVYEGPTDFQPDLPRIEHVVMAGDFEAVSTWIVGLHLGEAPPCLVVQAFAGNRLVVAFVGPG